MMYAVHNSVAGYLYKVPQKRNYESKKMDKKVEATSETSTGKRFNSNAANKTNHSHIDNAM